MSSPRIDSDRPRTFLVDRMRAIDRAVTRQVRLALPDAVAGHVSTPHMRLMAEVPPAGIRPSQLAERLGVTRSAVSQLIGSLEQSGLLERTVDATDRRADLVRQTAKAGIAQRAARDTIEEIERTWSDRLGAERFATLQRALEDLYQWSTAPDSESDGAPPS
jgi:DNA-binding MarR family transcriptional regulator